MKSIILLSLLLSCFSVLAESTTLETEEQIAKNNVWQAARLRGISFRAIGQEPGWLLEISKGEKIDLIMDYGRTKITASYVDPIVDPNVNPTQHTTVFTVKDQKLEIIIVDKECSDVLSGEKFNVSVFVTLKGKKFKGCGKALY